MISSSINFNSVPAVRPVVRPSPEARLRAKLRSEATCYNGMDKAFEKVIEKENR